MLFSAGFSAGENAPVVRQLGSDGATRSVGKGCMVRLQEHLWWSAFAAKILAQASALWVFVSQVGCSLLHRTVAAGRIKFTDLTVNSHRMEESRVN